MSLFSCVCILQAVVYCHLSWAKCYSKVLKSLSLKGIPLALSSVITAVIFQFVNIFLITSFGDKAFELECCTKPFDTGKSLEGAAGLLSPVQIVNIAH